MADKEVAESRRELLEQQFSEAESAPSQADQSVSAPAGDEKPARARGDDGKFVPVDKAAKSSPTEAEKPAPAASSPSQPVAAGAAPLAEEPAWKRPPTSWKKDYHDLYKGLDPKAQEYVFQREEQMRAGVEPLLPKAKFADEMQAAIEPYMPTIRGLGIEPAKAVQALMQADHNLRNLPQQQKLAYFAQLGAQYGIDLSQAAGQVPQGQVTDPNFFALQNELNTVRGEIVSFKQAQEAQQQQALLADINAFSKKAEHFEEVVPTMIPLLQSGMAETLQEAYDKAIRLNPDLYASIEQAKQAQAQAAQATAKNTAAKAAKAAAVSVKSSTPGAQTQTKAQDRRSMLLEQFDNLSGRL